MTLSPHWARLAPLVRGLGETRVFGPALRATYVAAAHAAAAAFGRIPGVTAVMASGSITHPEMLAPGTSDIDLLLVVDAPTLDAELTLRRGIAKVHGTLHRALPVFTNLDYVEERDLDLLRAFGNAWSMDFDRRFVCLGGADPRAPHPRVMPRPEEERRLEWAVFAVKSWFRGCSDVLDPRADPGRTPRRLERLVTDLLASALDQDRFTPRAELLTQARARGTFPLAGLLPLEGPLPLEAGLAAALESAMYLVESVSAAWQGPFPIDSVAPTPEAGPDVRRFVSLARREGLGAALVPRGSAGGGALAAAVAPLSDQPTDVVRRAARLLADAAPFDGPELRWLRLPVVIPPSFVRAAALWGPSPLVGPAMARSTLWLEGSPPGPPCSPPAPALRSLLRARTLQQFVRRPARADRSPAAFAAELAFEDRSLRPALASALDTGRFRLAFEEHDPASEAEPARVEALRAWLDGRRAALARDLTERRRSSGVHP